MTHQETGTLEPAPPFDFAKTLAFLGQFAPAEGEQALAGRSLTKAVATAGRAVVFRLAPGGTVEAPRLTYTLFSATPLDERARAAVIDRIRFYLSLDDDLTPFYELAHDDPPFDPIVARLYGYHQVKFLTPFENACWAILSQRTPIAAARKLKAAVTERFGARLVVEGEEHRAFPEPARLAAVPEDDLAALLGGGAIGPKRAARLRSATEAFAATDEGWLRTAPHDEVEAWLRAIDGVGAWSASFVLLRGLGRMERLPSGERRLAEAVSEVYGGAVDAGGAAIRRHAERYGPWQGYWAHYLRVGA